MPRFTDDELEQLFIDPHRGGSWGVCPFCGGHIVWGCRKDNGNQTVAHTALPDPLHPGQLYLGCERWRELAQTNLGLFLSMAGREGLRLQPLHGV